MRVTVNATPSRKKPKAGDRRTTKKHGLQIRVQARSENAQVVRNDHLVWVWKKPRELEPREQHWLTPQERHVVAHAADIEASLFFGDCRA